MTDNTRAALLGLVGALVGGLIAAVTSFGVTLITEKETAAAETKKATGAARLLVEDFRRAEGQLGNSLADCTNRLYDLNIELPIEDRLFLAWRLAPKNWLRVADATSDLKLQIARSREKHQFVHADVVQITYVIKELDQAGPALENVS